MKRLFITCIILAGVCNPEQAQSRPFNKLQIPVYIRDIYKILYKYKGFTIAM